MIRKILLLGDPALYQVSAAVTADDSAQLSDWVRDLHDTLLEYRRVHGAGRAIAAPQIGIAKRLLYMHIGEPYVFINPVLSFPDNETYTVRDDCMSFPGLTVAVRRYRRAVIRYLDMEFQPREMRLEGDLSELLQHEYDHLDGILATMRAIDARSFYFETLRRDF